MRPSSRLALALWVLAASGASAADLWPSLSSAKAVGGGENDAAVIVGVEKYPFVEHVPGARLNAEDWHAYLTDALKVPSDRVTLLRDEEATLEEMRQFVSEQASAVKPGGTLWFVFVGHGSPSKDGKDGMLVGVDAQQRAESLFSRSLSRSELLGRLAKGKQAKTVVLIDACFSGRTAAGQPLVKGLQPLTSVPTVAAAADGRTILLTAARSDQFAGTLPKSSAMRPAFSYLALGGLRGWAADESGKVTAGGLLEFTRKALRLAKDRTQTPELASGAAGAVLGSGKEAAPDLARIDRQGAAASAGFQLTSLPALPSAQAPAEMSAAPSMDWKSADVDALERYDAALKADKSGLAPAAKADIWKNLSKSSPAFAELADRRAAEWTEFAARQKEAEEARLKRMAARDADWKKLERLLALQVVKEDDKKDWVQQFLVAYMKSPGLTSAMADKLVAYAPTAEAKAEIRNAAVQKLAYGIRVEQLRAGDGPQPTADDTVSVHYRGTFWDGKEFDSSYSRGSPASFPLKGVIKCWTEGVQQIRVGGKAKLTCPPESAYGAGGVPPSIPGNATLYFEVELIGILPK
jgi:FKBP-type peptidyl-prolyl cis-trans isomerase FkpA